MKGSYQNQRDWKATSDGLCHRGCSSFHEYEALKGTAGGGPQCGIFQGPTTLNSGCRMLNVVAALENHFHRRPESARDDAEAAKVAFGREQRHREWREDAYRKLGGQSAHESRAATDEALYAQRVLVLLDEIDRLRGKVDP